MQAATKPNSDAAATAPEALIAAAVAQLTALYHAKGDLELSFVRQIAGAQFTIDALERTVVRLSATDDPDAAAIDRLTRIQVRKQRMITVALKELKALQSLRNAVLQYPDQTEDMPPLADQMPFIGFRPQIYPIPENILARARSVVAAAKAAQAARAATAATNDAAPEPATPATTASAITASATATPGTTCEMPLPRGFEHFPDKEAFLKARAENAARR